MARLHLGKHASAVSSRDPTLPLTERLAVTTGVGCCHGKVAIADLHLHFPFNWTFSFSFGETTMGGLDRMIASADKNGIATGDPDADALLRADPNAIVIGILLDQQIRAETAFAGPYKLAQRLGRLDMKEIATMDPEAFKVVFGQKPAVHRFANMMAERVQKLAQAIEAKYDGDASQIWADGADLKTVEKRAKELPGFGANKVKMMKEVLELFGHRGFS